MRAHGAFGLAAMLLVSTSAAGQPDSVPYPTPAIPITSHAVTADDYPLESVRQLEQGASAVRFVISETGDVAECTITESSGHPRLDDAACAMIRSRWKYKPATVNGQPVAQNTTANIVFQLSDVPGGFTGLRPIPPPPLDPSQSDPVFDIPDSYVPPSGTAP